MLNHGGRLLAAAFEENIPVDRWLDLSTGISPFVYPLLTVPESFWHRLPEDEDGLVEIAAAYYGVDPCSVVCLAGSQSAIQVLPQLRTPGKVGLLSPSYNEHAHAWKVCGHDIREFQNPASLEAAAPELDVIVVCNPNNPTGHLWSRAALRELAEGVGRGGGLLVIDEAFADAAPENSSVDLIGSARVVILRSLGKFFGLAGMRVGFALGAPDLIEPLRSRLGPWSVAGPSRFVAARALADQNWHVEQRHRLAATSAKLADVLEACNLRVCGGTPYFQYVQCPDAKLIFSRLRAEAVLVRLFEEPCSLRFGLPSADCDFLRLRQCLEGIARARSCSPLR